MSYLGNFLRRGHCAHHACGAKHFSTKFFGSHWTPNLPWPAVDLRIVSQPWFRFKDIVIDILKRGGVRIFWKGAATDRLEWK